MSLHPIQKFMNDVVLVGSPENYTSINIPKSYLAVQATYAASEPVISTLIRFYESLTFKCPINIMTFVSRNGEEVSEILELPSKEFNSMWTPVMKQCVRDLLTHGFYILTFDDTDKETIECYYSRFNVGACLGMDLKMYSDEHTEKLNKMPKVDETTVHLDKMSIGSKKPVRIDPCSVNIVWHPNWLKGSHCFEVKTDTFQSINSLVFYDPSCFVYGQLPQSCVQRIIPYADSLEKIRKSQVAMYIQMPHPLLVVSNNTSTTNVTPPMPINIANREMQDAEILNRVASTMVSNYSTSNELIKFSIRQLQEETRMHRKLPSPMKSNLVKDEEMQKMTLDSDRVLGLPVGHSAIQLNQNVPVNIKETMEEMLSLIAMQFAVYPTFFTGDIKNTTNEGLRLLYQQICNFVINLQDILKGHMSLMLQHCFPEIRLKLAKTQFEYYNSRVEVAFSNSEFATVQDIMDVWNIGVISDEAFINKIKGIFNLMEIDNDFKPTLISDNVMRQLEKERLRVQIDTMKKQDVEKDVDYEEKNADEERSLKEKDVDEERSLKEKDKNEEEKDADEKERSAKKRKII